MNLSLYITPYLYWSLHNYAAHAADILTPSTVVQSAANHYWGLYCRHCYRNCIYWVCSWRIFHFHVCLASLAQSYNQGWDGSPHIGNTFTPLRGVFYSPKRRTPGRRDIDFMSLPNDDGGPWDGWLLGRKHLCSHPPHMELSLGERRLMVVCQPAYLKEYPIP